MLNWRILLGYWHLENQQMKVGSLLNQEVIGIQQAVSVLLLLVEIFGVSLNLLQIFFGAENYIQRDIGKHIPITELQVYPSVA